MTNLKATNAESNRFKIELDSIKSQLENCQLANQGLERELKNIANSERRAQDNLRNCQIALGGNND